VVSGQVSCSAGVDAVGEPGDSIMDVAEVGVITSSGVALGANPNCFRIRSGGGGSGMVG
jgi:hypothetical protein